LIRRPTIIHFEFQPTIILHHYDRARTRSDRDPFNISALSKSEVQIDRTVSGDIISM